MNVNFAKVLLIKRSIIMQKINFNKLWITTKEMLNITSLSESRLYRMTKEWEKSGNDPKDMGRITLKGKKISYLWDPRIFANWLIKYQMEQPIKYDYEFTERENLKQILVYNNLPINQQQRKVI